MATEKASSTCYMAKSPDGVLAVSVGGWVSSQDARNAKVRDCCFTWAQLYRRGWRVVRVDIGEI